MKDLKRGIVLDSIVQDQQLQIINFKDVLLKDSQIIKEKDKKLLNVSKQLKISNLKLQVSRKLSFIGIPTAIISGFILGFIISK